MRTYICDKCGKAIEKPTTVTLVGMQIRGTYSKSWDFCEECLKKLKEEIENQNIFPT